MIKVEELSVGDWFEFPQCVDLQIDSIEKINDSKALINHHLSYDGFLLSELKPIPITPEILEKNGFERYGFSDIFGINILGNDSSICLRSHDSTIRGKDITVNNRKMLYVHELQNALRLCNIDKEIEL